MKKIDATLKTVTLVGTAYPYRGGLASFNEMLVRTFARNGKKAKIETFTVQYPSLLFPGKTQYSASPKPNDLTIERSVNSVNPFNWFKVGNRLRKERPDLLIVRYWTPFMAPCLGTLCYIVKRNRHTRIIPLLDNVIPHEHHFFDKWLTRYFLGSIHGGLYMSQQVKDDLITFNPKMPTRFSPHPLYANYGEKVERKTACQHLDLSEEIHYLLFFGIIRDYKGLDVLIDAWELLKDKGLTSGKKIIVAGEYYNNKEKYLAQMEQWGVANDFIVHDYFVKDEEVKYYFSASDVVVQPYKNATQSGVTQIAYQFEVPMIVTNVGGLAEIVPHDKVGYVTEATSEAICQAIEQFYASDGMHRFAENIKEERKRFTWEALTAQFESLYQELS